METVTFVPSLPGSLLPKSRAGRRNRCKIRAIAEQPGGGDGDELKVAKESLEKLFGMDLKTEKGNGQCACIWCEGSGKRRCSWCNGKGYRMENAEKSWEQLALDIQKMEQGGDFEMPEKIKVQCSACGGSCKLKCRFCRGSGVGSYGHAY